MFVLIFLDYGAENIEIVIFILGKVAAGEGPHYGDGLGEPFIRPDRSEWERFDQLEIAQAGFRDAHGFH